MQLKLWLTVQTYCFFSVLGTTQEDIESFVACLKNQIVSLQNDLFIMNNKYSLLFIPPAFMPRGI